MSEIPDELLYTKDHEWIKLFSPPDTSAGQPSKHVLARVGITAFAALELGDITYVDFTGSAGALNVGDAVSEGEEAAVIESVKAASDIYVPYNGTVEELNEYLISEPELINDDPYGAGWVFVIEVLREDQTTKTLLTSKEYRDMVG
jgi:glycine cleavage system H protein